MSDTPLALLTQAIAACQEAGAAYAVIGAVARNAWAPPRATADLDLAVSVTPAAYARLVEALARRGLTVRRVVSADADATLPDVALLERDTGLVRRLDLLVAKTAFEEEAIARAVERDLGIPCRVVRPEHLIVYKLIAGRPRDLADAEEVVRTRNLAGEAVDLTVVRHWAGEWGLSDRLEQLLRVLAAGPG